MNIKLMTFFTIISCLCLLTGLIVLYYVPPTRVLTPSFPFQVSGGTLIEVSFENHAGTIWGQSFKIIIIQEFSKAFKSEKYSILVFNFPTSGIMISGLIEEETFTIQGALSCKVELSGKIPKNRTITITHFPDDHSNVKFLAMGDTQGFSDLYEEMISSNNALDNDFILHLGDITASGDDKSLQKFYNISKTSKIPIFTTPGNHDIKISKSTALYEEYFGESEYFFEYKGFLFITLNSSAGYYSESSFSFLTKLLSEFPSLPKIIFTHIPIFDPRPGQDHALMNLTQSTRILSLLNDANVKAMISGHIHYFNYTIFNDITFLTSGGGGAYLYESPEDGGYHHYTEITINAITQELTINPIFLTKQGQPTDIIVTKGDVSQILALEDILSEFTPIYGNSSFQNQYNNWLGNGSYIGIKISSLIELVGGMNSSQWLTVNARDGLNVNYSYSVVYPNSSWYQIQGDMVLAFSFNNLIVPEYIDGYRIVFLPSDGSYSNEDCKNTSFPDEGWYIYPSAGYRWVKYVQSLIISGGG